MGLYAGISDQNDSPVTSKAPENGGIFTAILSGRAMGNLPVRCWVAKPER
ncbi:hypothetical protein NTCA1_49660 [Novosphingobium sp. TCA1]|nr:hypothetical protein NTCA1_49660 [Novosphingobium sp. TCA1]